MLPFVPRKVAKALASRKNDLLAGPSSVSVNASSTSAEHVSFKEATTSNNLAVPEATEQEATNSESRWKGKAKDDVPSRTLSEDDCIALLCLALSEHALWLDSDLRWRVESSDEGCEYPCTTARSHYPNSAMQSYLYYTSFLAPRT